MHRRQYLATTALAAVGLAGCSDDEGGNGNGDDGDEPADGGGSDGGDGSPADTDTPAPASPPQVQFSFDLGGGSLTITHTSGEAVVAGNVYARGENTYGFDGSWPEANASGDVNGQPAVTAGDFWEASAEDDVHIKLVWESGSTSVTLAQFEGPNY